MTDTFIITVDNEDYEVRDMPIGRDGGIFEIWHKGELQFIIHHVITPGGNPNWEAGPEENYNIDDAFIRKIGYAIEAHYD